MKRILYSLLFPLLAVSLSCSQPSKENNSLQNSSKENNALENSKVKTLNLKTTDNKNRVNNGANSNKSVEKTEYEQRNDVKPAIKNNTSFEVKYFVAEVDKIAKLTPKQRLSLEKFSGTNISEKISLQRELRVLEKDRVGNNSEIQNIRKKIQNTILKEKENLKKILTEEQYNLYEDKLLERKVNNQLQGLRKFLTLTAKQTASISALYTNFNRNQEIFTKSLRKARDLGNKKDVSIFIKKRTLLVKNFNTSMEEILSKEQYKIFLLRKKKRGVK